MREEEKLETEETVEPEEETPEEEVAEPETVEPEEAPEEEAPIEVEEPEVTEEVVEEKAPVEEEAVAEEAAAEALPNIFVADSSIPPGTLSGGRVLVVVDEKKAYPMSEEVNAWVLSHGVPIKVSTPELGRQMKELGIVGQTNFPDLTALAEKLGE